MAINVGEYSISLDGKDPDANVSFVSHAHTDHLSGIRKDRKVIASAATKDLIELRDSRKRIELAKDPKNVRMLSAGHILGSRQLYTESEELGASILYSGDYQTDRSLAAEPIETKEADILIVDSTYPDRETVFGDREETMSSIQSFMKAKLERGIVLFGSYALGKSQELNLIANEAGIVPVVDEKIAAINRVYSRHGISMEYLSSSEDEDETAAALRSNFMGIVPVHRLAETARGLGKAHGKRVYTAVATGFARSFGMGTDAQFPLSDHADFRQALEYIGACNPREIYTRGNRDCSERFARNLSMEGYKAEAFTGRVAMALSSKAKTI